MDLPFDEELYYKMSKINYEFHKLSCGFNSKIALISMVCSLKKAYYKSNKNISFDDLILKLSPETSDKLREEISHICEYFYDVDDEYNNYGFNSAKEIKYKIQQILNTELPF